MSSIAKATKAAPSVSNSPSRTLPKATARVAEETTPCALTEYELDVLAQFLGFESRDAMLRACALKSELPPVTFQDCKKKPYNSLLDVFGHDRDWFVETIKKHTSYNPTPDSADECVFEKFLDTFYGKSAKEEFAKEFRPAGVKLAQLVSGYAEKKESKRLLPYFRFLASGLHMYFDVEAMLANITAQDTPVMAGPSLNFGFTFEFRESEPETEAMECSSDEEDSSDASSDTIVSVDMNNPDDVDAVVRGLMHMGFSEDEAKRMF